MRGQTGNLEDTLTTWIRLNRCYCERRSSFFFRGQAQSVHDISAFQTYLVFSHSESDSTKQDFTSQRSNLNNKHTVEP